MPGIYYPNALVTLQAIFDDRASTGVGGAGSIAGSADKPVIVQVRPKSVTVHLTNYREADTFEIEFDATTFPISPEIIQAMGVEIHIFQTAQQQGFHLAQATGSDFVDDGGVKVLTEKNLVLSGLVDEAHLHVGSDGRSFRASGRDYTCLMLDRQWDPTKRVPVGKDLKSTVEDLVVQCDAAKVMTVELVGVPGDTQLEPAKNARDGRLITDGKYSVSKKGKLSNPVVGAGHSKMNKKGVPQHGGSSFWDVIYRLCFRHGFIAYVRGTKVIITTPKTLTQATAGRAKYVAMGINLAALDIDRKIGKETVSQVKIISYDKTSRTSLQAVYPKVFDATTKITGIGTEKDKVIVYVVDGIKDQAQLARMAAFRYHNLCRSEAKIRFQTKSLTDLNEVDMLDLRPADPVQLSFDAIAERDYKELTVQQRLDKLLALGYDETVARIVATEYDRVNTFSRPFYTQDVEYTFTIDDGITITVTAINYIHQQNDADEP